MDMPACIHTLFSPWQCGEDCGYTIKQYLTLRLARVIAGRDDVPSIARASVTVQKDVALQSQDMVIRERSLQ